MSDPGEGQTGFESVSASGGAPAEATEGPAILTTTSSDDDAGDATGGGAEPMGGAASTTTTTAGADDGETTVEPGPGATSTGPGEPGGEPEASTGGSEPGSEPESGSGSEPKPEPGDGGGDGEGSTGGQGDLPPPPNVTEPELLVALVGDQGTGSDTKAVYQLIKDEGADFLIIAGDFDYGDNPDAWAKEMDSVLGDSYPVFAAVGNHDVPKWSGYQGKLKARLQKMPGAECEGDLGVDSSCKYKGLHFVLSGLGTKGSDSDHEEYIAQSLAADDSLWSLCVWHKNQRDLQAGDKPDDIGWKGLQHCQDNGAIVVMAHEHSYARTKTLTDVGNKGAGHGAVGVPEVLEVGPGKTFSAVSGLGGKSIRDYDAGLHNDDSWWGTIYSGNYYLKNGAEIKDFEADHGVMFIRFHVGGDPKAAHGYFKNIQGDVIDEFDVVHK